MRLQTFPELLVQLELNSLGCENAIAVSEEVQHS
jgi:hypothetical protein